MVKKRVILNTFLKLILFSAIVVFWNCKSSYKKETTKYSPLHLSVEYIRQPENSLIVDAKPEFAWELPEGVSEQNAYQIIVASTRELINKDSGNIWDSEKVLSNNSVNVTFAGKPLEVGKTYFWKVKVWGEKNEETSFSKVQNFTIGKQKNTITSANLFQIDSIKPLKYNKTGNSSYVIDFGKDAFANLHFYYNTKENDTLIFHIGEQLSNGKINRKPKGTIRYQKIKVPVNAQKKEYLLPIKPDKRNTKPVAVQLPDSFPVIMPFRYVAIENFKEKFEADNFTQLRFRSYWKDDTSYFTSSDTILNQVWDLCKYSIKATTFAGLYVDGDRERIPYEADAYINQLSHYTSDREYAMARQTIEYFMEHPTWPTEWQLHVALMFHADYMYTGNTELILKYYEELKHKTLVELRRKDGLISSEKATPEFMKQLGFKNPKTKLKDIVDWPPAQKDTGWKLATAEGELDGFVFTPINTVVNCFYYKNLLIMKEFAQIVGNTKDVDFFDNLSKKVEISINTKLFNAQKGVYTDGEETNHAALHSNMLALAFDLVPEEHTKSVATFIKTRGMACSVYGSQYLLEALYKANEADYAIQLITATHDRSWYNMIDIGATITLEAWDMKYKPNADWNHAWGATPANIISRYLWGITPKTPGYSVATINPQLSNLKKSTISVPTLRGKITGNYTIQENGTKKYTIEIPANMKAEFVVNTTSKVKLNNKKKFNDAGIIFLNSGRNIIEITDAKN
ncbi:family 78 glycoside hydrolase catalytic domain [Polaribacter sp.]|nr:family 78 glycoside hydrolase catalytic domain [Polaribacter sp.]